MTGLSGLVMRGICSIFAQNKTDYDTTTAIHTFQIPRRQRLGRSLGALRKVVPLQRTLERGGLRPGFRRPEFRSRRHLARRGVHRHPLPLGCRPATVMSSTWPSRPPCGDKTWAPRHSRPSAGRSGASSSKSTRPKTTFRSAARHFYERLGFVANPYQYIHPSFRKPFTPHRLVLMSYPGAITYEEARSFADFVREAVLRYSEHEAPALPKLP